MKTPKAVLKMLHPRYRSFLSLLGMLIFMVFSDYFIPLPRFIAYLVLLCVPVVLWVFLYILTAHFYKGEVSAEELKKMEDEAEKEAWGEGKES